MKKELLCLGLVSSMLSTNLLAQDENFIELGTGYMSSKDNFSVVDTNNPSENKEGEVMPVLKAEYVHELSKQLSAKAGFKQGAFELALAYKLADTTLEVGVPYKIGKEEVWKDPYNKATNTATTDASEQGYFASLSHEFGAFEVSLAYEGVHKDYEDDQAQALLKRSGTEQKYTLEGKVGPFMLALFKEDYNADGTASSYSAYGFEAGGGMKFSERLKMMMRLGYGTREYDAINPELNTLVEVDVLTAKVQVKYEQPFGFKDTYVKLMGMHEKESANHSFFDKSQSGSMLSFAYLF